MDMEKRAKKIYHMHVKDAVKIKLLQEFILDCTNELEAQDQNMQPQVHHNLGEGLRVATNYLRKLGVRH